ncbi:hypothetical protein [Thermococcus barophilus]|uniref:Uncharacterized protein n=1 Tax=Thermococcus barophilus (strain DSM 11836 / MP) TaxID=391623 RepID=F0LKH2_THEBM|nr:hypothetical protein [Thermococcus barophilus]ADT83630.1 hypothetical protein TERMP_00653 [Thermococcus barophilus MP]
MATAYKLAVLPIVGSILARIMGPTSPKTAAYLFVIFLVLYPGWFIYKTSIAGFYEEEKGQMIKAFVLWFACFVGGVVILFAG